MKKLIVGKTPRKQRKSRCTWGPGAHFSARVQGLDLVLEHWHRVRILAQILKKGVCTLMPSEYRTQAPVLWHQV